LKEDLRKCDDVYLNPQYYNYSVIIHKQDDKSSSGPLLKATGAVYRFDAKAFLTKAYKVSVRRKLSGCQT
jgi:hypothetical protein